MSATAKPDPNGCTRCGRVECPTRKYDGPDGKPTSATIIDSDGFDAAVNDCDARTVDWRALYFAEAARTSASPAPPSPAGWYPVHAADGRPIAFVASEEDAHALAALHPGACTVGDALRTRAPVAPAWRKEAPTVEEVMAQIEAHGMAHWWSRWADDPRPLAARLDVRDGVVWERSAAGGWLTPISYADPSTEWSPCIPPATTPESTSVDGTVIATGRVVSVGKLRVTLAWESLDGIAVGDDVRLVRVTPLDGGEGK